MEQGQDTADNPPPYKEKETQHGALTDGTGVKDSESVGVTVLLPDEEEDVTDEVVAADEELLEEEVLTEGPVDVADPDVLEVVLDAAALPTVLNVWQLDVAGAGWASGVRPSPWWNVEAP